MGQQRLGKVAEDDLSKRPTKITRRKTGNTILDATTILMARLTGLSIMVSAESSIRQLWPANAKQPLRIRQP